MPIDSTSFITLSTLTKAYDVEGREDSHGWKVSGRPDETKSAARFRPHPIDDQLADRSVAFHGAMRFRDVVKAEAAIIDRLHGIFVHQRPDVGLNAGDDARSSSKTIAIIGAVAASKAEETVLRQQRPI